MTAKGCFVVWVVVLLLLCVVKDVLLAEIDGCAGGDSACRTSNRSEDKDLHVVELHTSVPVPKPTALNMMADEENQDEVNFRPTPLSLTTLPITNSSLTKLNSTANATIATKSNGTASEEPRGRALNFTLHDAHVSNNLSNSTNHDEFDLSDVTINDGDDDNMEEMISPKILVPMKSEVKTTHNVTTGHCEEGGLTYENGEKLENGCDSICTCKNGKMDCADRCIGPFFRKGKRIEDPLCSEKSTEDPCCSVMVCASDTETEPLEICSFGNKTYNRGDTFDKDCSEVCVCEIAGKVSCKPRCPEPKKTSESCVEIPDPNDTCCKKILCDVTLDDHQDHEKEETMKPNKHKIVSAAQANSSVIILDIHPKYGDDEENLPIVEASNDKENWNYYQLFPKGELFVKELFKYIRLEGTEEIVEVKHTKNEKEEKNRISKEILKEQPKNDDRDKEIIGNGCEYKGKNFKSGEEYNDGCESLCVCHAGEMKCLKLECPTYFGVDVLDPGCVEWETIPPNFEPSAPNCCPEQVRCKNNGSCLHEGTEYKNWEQLPLNVTGCEKRCYCEMGKVECQNTCPPVPALPPPNLACPPKGASLRHVPDDDCCMYWICVDPKDQAAVRPPPNKTTKPDKKGHVRNQTDFELGPFGPFVHEKQPSKVLGPLSVYTNDDDDSPPDNRVNPLHRPLPPHLTDDENPFVRDPHHGTDFPKPSKSHINNKNNKNKAPPFPITPTVTNKRPYLGFNKSGQFFRPETAVMPSGNLPPNIPLHPKDHQISIHGQGSPEDFLQFLQHHPEISDLPSGSVLEIHNVSPTKQGGTPAKPVGNQQHQFGHVNDINLYHPNINHLQKPPLVPHLLHPEQGRIPQDLSLEQILEELHKNINPQGPGPLAPFPHTPPFSGHDLDTSGSKTANKSSATGRPQDSFNNHYPDDFGFNQPRDEISVHALEAVDPHTIRLAFMVPPVIVGLHGRVEVRYTYKDTEDVSSWDLQVFAPPNDLIATPSLEFDLLDLVPDKEYKIKITITLRDLHNTPSSKIYKIRTPKDVQITTLPPQIPIEPDLEISDINSTWVTVVWRKFTEYELQFIDGVQLRYREIDGKIYTATPLIHRAVTTYTIENLKPNTKYEIGIFFIPFPGQLTELNAEHMLQYTTANLVDTYGFSVILDVSQVKSTSIEIAWSGVPYPEDKYVNIYRAIYQSDSGKEDHSTFKIAKRDSPTKTIITDLKPGTRYRLWLEVYLTNGKIKTSNVQDFVTKPRAAPALGSSSQDKVSRAEFADGPRGDYYGPLVIVAILAAIAILSTLILLLILVRRHNQNKAAITPPSTRISQSAYDNPTYKVEIQQETMGL